MKIYLAAPYAARDLLKEHLSFWEGLGYEITCGWVKGTRPLDKKSFGASEASTDDEVFEHVTGDLEDIDAADVLVHYTGNFLESMGFNDHDHRLHTGGRHVETGYAIAKQKPVVIIGEPENVFQRGLCLSSFDLHSAHEAVQMAATSTDRYGI